MSKRALQLAVAAGGFVPVAAGFAGVIFGPVMVGAVRVPVPMDSHYRYLSGLLAGIGIAFWTTIPHIERNGSRFRLLTAIVVTGGLGRLLSLLTVGTPDRPMLFGLAMELAITPALALWQYRVEKKLSLGR